MRIRRVLAATFVLAYLVYLAAGTYSQILGDVPFSPAATYFVTWDMFPGHRGTSERVLVVGETEQGEHLLLYPSPRQRWRGGLHGDLTRLDFGGAPLSGTAAGWLEREIALAIKSHDEAWPEDPVRHVSVVREFWPARYNVPKHDSTDDPFGLVGDRTTRDRFRQVVLRAPAADFRARVSEEATGAGQGSPR